MAGKSKFKIKYQESLTFDYYSILSLSENLSNPMLLEAELLLFIKKLVKDISSLPEHDMRVQLLGGSRLAGLKPEESANRLIYLASLELGLKRVIILFWQVLQVWKALILIFLFRELHQFRIQKMPS